MRSSTACRSRFSASSSSASVLRLVGVLGQQQRERRLGPAEPARRVDARREPEADRRLVDGGGIDTARHASARAGPASASARAGAGRAARARGSRRRAARRRRPSRARRRRGAGRRNGWSGPSSAWASFQTTPVPQRPANGIVALQRRDDGAGGERLGRAVVVGDDDLEPERARVLDLGDGGDAAVDGQDEVEALLGEPRQRAGVQAVALLEARRQVPRDSALVSASSRSSSTASAVAQMPSAS